MPRMSVVGPRLRAVSHNEQCRQLIMLTSCATRLSPATPAAELGHARIDNSYTPDLVCVSAVYSPKEKPCATPPSTCVHYPISET